jgi:hypothetical protein
MHVKIYKEIIETYSDGTPLYGGPGEIVKKDSYNNTKYLSIEDIILKVAKKTKQSINTIRNEYYNKTLEKHTQIINDNTHDHILELADDFVITFKREVEWNQEVKEYMKAWPNGEIKEICTKDKEFFITLSFCKEMYDSFHHIQINEYKNKGWDIKKWVKKREIDLALYNNMLKIKNFKIQIYSPNGAITEGNVTCQSIDIKSFKKHLKKSSPFYYYPMAFPEEPKITKNYSIDIPLNK